MIKECGDCTACCTLSYVKEINKKAWDTCKFCKNNGCSIYEERPQDCKDFECAYLQGGNSTALRPDKCGIMFFKKSDRIFCGALVPGVTLTDMARGQIEAFKKQGYSVVLLKQFAKPLLDLAEGHDKEEIWKEYLNLVMDGNL